MLKNKKATILLGIILLIVFMFLCRGKEESDGIFKTQSISPVVADISIVVSTTGVVEPQNRLQINPSIGGRIEEVLVKEGDFVKEGDILAWMSSTDRAALVDAARSQGEEALDYWEEVYKKTPIISPINGSVIVRSVEPGQSVTTSDTVLVLSDRLVVSAQFDETDIGRVKVGQRAFVTLEAYPDVEIGGVVVHIAYESEVVNNVTIYNVDILPRTVPEILRSGMSVDVEVIEKEAKAVITVPAVAIQYDKGRQFVLVKDKNGRITERDVMTGISDGRITEIMSGLSLEDTVIIKSASYSPRKKNKGTNPFLPSRRR